MNRKVSRMTAKLLSEQLEDWNYLLRWVRSRVTQACEGKKSRVPDRLSLGCFLDFMWRCGKEAGTPSLGFRTQTWAVAINLRIVNM